MQFTDAVKSFYKRAFDFQGRSSRLEYWWVQLFMVLVMLVPGFAYGLSEASGGGTLGSIAAILLGLFFLINVIPTIAVTVRRFHDQNRSGWMYLLSFIPYLGVFIIIIFMCLRGTPGENRFGMDPLGGYGDTFS